MMCAHGLTFNERVMVLLEWKAQATPIFALAQTFSRYLTAS
jgi:hypothetical protein